MKSKCVLGVFLFVLTITQLAFAQSNSAAITGAWQIKEADKEQVLIFQDGFFFHTATIRARSALFTVVAEHIRKMLMH